MKSALHESQRNSKGKMKLLNIQMILKKTNGYNQNQLSGKNDYQGCHVKFLKVQNTLTILSGILVIQIILKCSLGQVIVYCGEKLYNNGQST